MSRRCPRMRVPIAPWTREPGGDERSEPEQPEHLAQQPVVALRLGPGLLPCRDLADRAGPEHGDGALDGVVGVLRVGQAQPGDLAAGITHGGRQRPDEPGLFARAVTGFGAVGDAHDGQGPCRAGHRQQVAGLGQQRPGQPALQHHAVGLCRGQPAARRDQRAADGGCPRCAAQFHRGAGAPGRQGRGLGGVGTGHRLDAPESGQFRRVGVAGGVDPDMSAVGLREDPLPGVGRVTEKRCGEQQGADDARGGEDHEQCLAAMRPQIGVGPAQGGSHGVSPSARAGRNGPLSDRRAPRISPSAPAHRISRSCAGVCRRARRRRRCGRRRS